MMKGKRKNKGSLPGAIGRAARRSGVIRSIPPRITSEMVPAVPEVVVNPERELHLRRLVGKFSGELNRKALKVQFLALIAPGADQLRLGPAWKALHPRSKATDKSCTERGSAFYAEIMRDLGPDPDPVDVLALCGIHVGSIGEDLAAARGAMFEREYYNHKTGEILTGKARPDHLVRLRQVELSMKAIGLGKENSSSSPVVVNIISYAPLSGPGSLKDDPWPGGGRGSLPVETVNSTPALPSPTKTIVYDPASVSTGNRHD